MRIGCLQFAPEVGHVENNLNRADAVLNRVDDADMEDLDLLVLPELAFSGYNFKSRDEITPFVEPSGSGISSLWARTTALKYDCVVAVGYPERVPKESAGEDFYNSLVVVNGDGETVANYRKSSLYYTDETWAKEGGGFYQGEIQGMGKVAMGICKRANVYSPYKFQTPWTDFEFGVHILRVKANLVIISMAWLTIQDARTFTTQPEEPDVETLTYWVQRMEPVIRAEGDDEIIVVFANRCGVEGDAVYAGTSAVLGVQGGEVSVYGLLGRGSKELLIVNTDMPPFAKLVSRPDGRGDADEELSVSDVGEPAVPSVQEGVRTDRKSPTRSQASSRGSDSGQGHRQTRGYEGQRGDEYFPAARHSSRREVSSPRKPASPREDRTSGEAPSVHDSYQDRYRHSPKTSRDYGRRASPREASPVFPEPTPMSMRPKLAISTGPETLPPIQKRAPPRGVQPGNFFSSRDLCTPPETPFDDEPQPFIQQPWIPPSAFMHTPEEPEWPGANPGTDFPRVAGRTVPSRPASRTQEVKLSDLDDTQHHSRHQQEPQPRRPSTSPNTSRAGVTERPAAGERNAPKLRTKRSDSAIRPDIQQSRDTAPRTRHPSPPKTAPIQTLPSASFPWNSITIAASPSVFKTTFARSETFPRRAVEDDRADPHRNQPHSAREQRTRTETERKTDGSKVLKRSKSISAFHHDDPTSYLPSPALPMHKAYQDLIYSAVEPRGDIEGLWEEATRQGGGGDCLRGRGRRTEEGVYV
ncbi:carbon-nitrogen hydrolase [Coniochaeta sp. 2T2.1]|nr:carbon-nitrogen hydrolase [Coniochaeta sp. 2T2.1]